VQALGGETREKMLGESVRERKLHDTSITTLTGKTESKRLKVRRRRLLMASLKTISRPLKIPVYIYMTESVNIPPYWYKSTSSTTFFFLLNFYKVVVAKVPKVLL
jgi:hypothetical protein